MWGSCSVHYRSTIAVPYLPPPKPNTQEEVTAFLGPSQSAICVAPKPLSAADPSAYLDLARFAKAAAAAAGGPVAGQALALFENAARQMDNALGQVGLCLQELILIALSTHLNAQQQHSTITTGPAPPLPLRHGRRHRPGVLAPPRRKFAQVLPVGRLQTGNARHHSPRPGPGPGGTGV